MPNNQTFDDIMSWYRSSHDETQKAYNEYAGNSTRTRSQRIDNIIGLYGKVWQNLEKEYRRLFLHDDNMFNKIINGVHDFITNKKKIAEGKPVVYVGDLAFNGSQEEYDKFFGGSDVDFSFVVKKIIEELQTEVEAITQNTSSEPRKELASFMVEYKSVSKK